MEARPQIVGAETEPLWFLGLLTRIKLDGAQTAGRFALVEFAPRGAAPPLHSHPQDETFYVLDGELTAWVVDRELMTAIGPIRRHGSPSTRSAAGRARSCSPPEAHRTLSASNRTRGEC